VQGQVNKCPFIVNTVCSESGRQEAMDLAFTAQAVLQGIVIVQFYAEQKQSFRVKILSVTI